MGKDLAEGSNCFWWGCLVLSWMVKGMGFAHWRVYTLAHPILPAELGNTWWLSGKLEIRGKRHCSCFTCPGSCWVLLHLRKFTKWTDIAAEGYPELKALSSITCLMEVSSPSDNTIFVNIILVSVCSGLEGSWAVLGKSCDETPRTGPGVRRALSTAGKKAIKNNISVNQQI